MIILHVRKIGATQFRRIRLTNHILLILGTVIITDYSLAVRQVDIYELGIVIRRVLIGGSVQKHQGRYVYEVYMFEMTSVQLLYSCARMGTTVLIVQIRSSTLG